MLWLSPLDHCSYSENHYHSLFSLTKRTVDSEGHRYGTLLTFSHFSQRVKIFSKIDLIWNAHSFIPLASSGLFFNNRRLSFLMVIALSDILMGCAMIVLFCHFEK
jgi:hypothetical protein